MYFQYIYYEYYLIIITIKLNIKIVKKDLIQIHPIHHSRQFSNQNLVKI